MISGFRNVTLGELPCLVTFACLFYKNSLCGFRKISLPLGTIILHPLCGKQSCLILSSTSFIIKMSKCSGSHSDCCCAPVPVNVFLQCGRLALCICWAHFSLKTELIRGPVSEGIITPSQSVPCCCPPRNAGKSVGLSVGHALSCPMCQPISFQNRPQPVFCLSLLSNYFKGSMISTHK